MKILANRKEKSFHLTCESTDEYYRVKEVFDEVLRLEGRRIKPSRLISKLLSVMGNNHENKY